MIRGQTSVKRRLDVLDYLRFVAAAMVVGYHYFYWGPDIGVIEAPKTFLAPVAQYGYLGVELFFLISGFVILESARGKTASRFAVARARRLYPAFLTIMLATVALVVLFGDGVVNSDMTPTRVLANLTMVPGLLGQPAVDGVYWSLQYEIEFYALVLLLLLLGQRRRLGSFLPWWALLMLAVMVIAPDAQGVVFLGSFFAFFAAGGLIAEVRHSGFTALRIVGLVAAAAVCIHVTRDKADAYSIERGEVFSPTIATVVVVVCLLLMMSMWSATVSTLSLPHARFVGGLTYPLYLLHGIVGYIFMHAWIDDAPLWVVYAVTVSLMLVASAAVYVLVERRHFWTPLFDRTVGATVRRVERLRGSGFYDDARAVS